jgi:hypothetical protein
MTKMSEIQVLSPVALGPSENRALAPAVASLRGKRLGIRHDKAWRSFEIFSDELERLAREQLGVAEVVRFDPGTRIGSPEAESARAVEFASRVDAAVVGLGT